MGDHECQLFLFAPDAQDLILHTHTGESIQCAERLVQQQDLRLVDQGANEGHTLCHTAGKLTGVIILELLQTDDIDHALHLILIALELALHFQREADVLLHSQPGEQGGLLEHHTTVGRGTIYFLAIHSHSAEGGGDETCHQAENGGLTAAGRTDEGDKFAAFHGDADVVESVGDFIAFHLGKAFADMIQLQSDFLIHYFSTPFCQRSR